MIRMGVHDLKNTQKELIFKNERHIFLNPFDELAWKGDEPIRKAWTIALRKAGVRYRNPYQQDTLTPH